MPVSITHSQLIYDSLKGVGVGLVSALPETWLVHLIRMVEDDPDMILVRLAKEEEGVGVSMGAYLAGMKSAMLMQNHGFLAAINGIVSGARSDRISRICRSTTWPFSRSTRWASSSGRKCRSTPPISTAFSCNRSRASGGRCRSSKVARTKGATHVKTGTDAVRRYALPNPAPAVHRCHLKPPRPIEVQRGTVQPAFGQPGGGVEIIFVRGSPAGTKFKQDQIPPR